MIDLLTTLGGISWDLEVRGILVGGYMVLDGREQIRVGERLISMLVTLNQVL